MELVVLSTPTYVSVSYRDGHRSGGVAEASQMPDGSWFLNRVLIPEQYRGEGRGKILVARLLTETTRQGCTKMVLTPGGYGSSPEELEEFYVKCGFRRIEPGLLEYP